MDKCLADARRPTTSSSASTRRTTRSTWRANTLIISMWTDAFGDKVQATITPIEQGQYIGLALNGTFQAFGWRSHFGTDPDQQRLWWQSASASPIGAAGAELRPLQGPRDRRRARHHQVEPRPGRPQGGGRGDQQAVRRAGLQLVADVGAVGDHLAALRPRRPGQHAARRRRASAWPSSACTTSTRCGATTASANDARTHVGGIGPRSSVAPGRNRSARRGPGSRRGVVRLYRTAGLAIVRSGVCRGTHRDVVRQPSRPMRRLGAPSEQRPSEPNGGDARPTTD